MKKILIIMLTLISSIVAKDISSSDFQFLTEDPKIYTVYYDKNVKKLVIQVKDDGTLRNAYAEYIYVEIASHNLSKYVNSVYVKDVSIPKKMIESGNGDYLGKWMKQFR